MAQYATMVSPESGGASSRGAPSALPADLLRRSVERLRIVGLIYAAIFFLAGVVPALAMPQERALFFAHVHAWLPSTLGILGGLALAFALRNPRLSLRWALNLGIVFEIVSSYAIATAEFGDPSMLETQRGFLGLSWVSVWVLFFTVVVPTSPRRAVLAALAAVSAVPVVIGLVIASGHTSLRINPEQYFFGLIFPYLIVVFLAYLGARVVYHLGTEVKRARELGSYQLEEKLGEGGMGEVWRARHRMLARPAAIKLIRPAAHGGGAHAAIAEQTIRRFEREAQVIAELRSPHTVELFDFGVSEDGAFYYAMELLDGFDADTLVRRFGPIPPERAIYLLRQVCHSLSESESRGLVHRDVKPANLFLCRYGEDYDFVKVLDFGIVRAVHEVSDAGPMLTRENTVLGTPAFIAPEQALGGTVDGRADIYATGCVAYWLLTGEIVFTADSAMAMIMKHAQEPPAPPSSRGDRPIPKALEDLVLSCLAKDPEHRPQTARELSQRLGALAGADAWTQEHARAWWTVNGLEDHS